MLTLEELKALTLETLVTKNKEEISITQVDEFDVPTCTKKPGIRGYKSGIIKNARIIKVSIKDGEFGMFIVGYYHPAGASAYPIRTSAIDCLHLDQIKTKNSVYKVEFTDKPLDLELLLMVCRHFQGSGLAEHYGTPMVY